MSEIDIPREITFPPINARAKAIIKKHYKTMYAKRGGNITSNMYSAKCHSKKCKKRDFIWDMVEVKAPYGSYYYCQECYSKKREYAKR